jgi:hypothetical protein
VQSSFLGTLQEQDSTNLNASFQKRVNLDLLLRGREQVTLQDQLLNEGTCQSEEAEGLSVPFPYG